VSSTDKMILRNIICKTLYLSAKPPGIRLSTYGLTPLSIPPQQTQILDNHNKSFHTTIISSQFSF